MEDQEEQQDNTSDQNHKPQDLPQVLLLKPPPVLSVTGEQPFLSKKYQFLKAWESPLPLIQFLTAHADSIQAILCSGAAPVTDVLLQLLPSVRLVVTASAGTNHIDLEACHRRGISVTNAGNVFSDDGADAAVGLLIDVLRKITASDRYVRQGLWVNKGDYPLGSKLRGKRVGIVGLGGIGLEIAKRLEAFGCNVLYNSRKKKALLSYPFYSDVRQLAAKSDALIICCALTDQTRHMIDKDVFSALGKEGVIVNIGRGAIVDEKEMVRCLVHGEIAGAGLDVFENEPDVPKELLELDNVVLSPHRAVFTPESFMALCELVLGGKKVGIVGLGSIGQEAAKGLENYGCNILYNSRTKKSSVPYPCYSNVCEVVANCEVLIICRELNDQTRHMISKEVFLALRKRGLINDVGRGAVIDEGEMVRCLIDARRDRR